MNTIYDDMWHLKGYSLAASWKRNDSHEMCIDSIHSFLKEFIELLPFWPPFFQPSFCKPECFHNVPDKDKLRQMFMNDIVKDRPSDAWGSRMLFSNTGVQSIPFKIADWDFRKVVEITLTVGAYNGNVNGIAISFPPINDELGERLTLQTFNDIFDLVVKCWRPICGRLKPGWWSSESDDYPFHNVGWVTYLSEKMGEIPKFPKWAILTPVEGYGTYIRAGNGLYEPDNPAHLKRMKKLQKP